MSIAANALPPAQRGFLERFTTACTADARVLAALLGGSYARGSADAYSDLDLGIIVSDAHYAAFSADRAAFLSRLGALIFLESFAQSHIAFVIYADGAEAELAIASPGRRDQIPCGPFQALYDRQGFLDGASFPFTTPTPEEQREALRREMACFWHDMAHFITALARGQHWWAAGQLEALRRSCINLSRLQHNPLGELCGHEKIDQALPAEALAPLITTWAPLERAALFQAGGTLVQRYQELAWPLAVAHGLAYPEELEQVMLTRLAGLLR